MKLLLPLLLSSIIQSGCFASQPANLRVRDAFTQEPLIGANVKLYVSHPPKESFGSRWYETNDLKETGEGVFTFSYPLASELKSSLSIHIKGYYPAILDLPTGRVPNVYDVIASLKPKQKPISLVTTYWSGKETKLFYSDKEGTKQYDCLKADWLPPDGNGIKADLEFSLQRYNKDGKTFAWFSIRFTNPNDGFEEVRERYAENMRIREAPATRQLQNQLDFIEEMKNGFPVKHPPQKHYAFRVRTQLTPSGDILSAYYGKLYDAFDFNYMKNYWYCGFEYYLNPTPNDRNLEYNGNSLNTPRIRFHQIQRIK